MQDGRRGGLPWLRQLLFGVILMDVAFVFWRDGRRMRRSWQTRRKFRFDTLTLRGLARRSRDAAQSRRLLALAAIYEGLEVVPQSMIADYQRLIQFEVIDKMMATQRP